MSNQLTIANTTVKTDAEGRYCLNDLHKAAGGESRHQPNYFMALDSTKALIEALRKSRDLGINPSEAKRGRNGGTFVVKQVVYQYAMWVSPDFNLKVIEAYDNLQTQGIAVADHAADDLLTNPLAYFEKVLTQAKQIQAHKLP